MNVNYMFRLLTLLVLLASHCWAQRGYDYSRPDLSGSVGPSNVGATAVATNQLRPLAGAFATPNSVTGTFPTTPTAFGGQSNLTPSTAFGGFAQRPAAGAPTNFVPTGQTAFGGTSTGTLQKRPNVAQRPATAGIYGASGQTPYTSGLRGSTSAASTGSGGYDADYEGDFSAIPGVPGVDYPVYSQMPRTNFDCAQQPLPGYYSDVEAQCQVFHICALNRTYSFLCPNGTVFSQETLVCVWWNQYDCASAPSLYANNAYIYDYGRDGAPTNAGYQGVGVGVGVNVASRQPNTFQATAAGRVSSQSPAVGVFGGSVGGNLRPSIVGGGSGTNYPANLASPLGAVTPTPFTTNQAGRAGLTRFAPGPSAAAAVGGVGGVGAGAPTGLGGVSGLSQIQNNSFTNAQAAGSNSGNREYLPPRRP